MTMSASGRATVNGTWLATDDDEATIILDPATLRFQVDPEAVTYTTLSGITTPETDSLKPAVVNSIQEHLKAAILNELLNIKTLDDIKINKNGLMTCEINDADITLQRQQ